MSRTLYSGHCSQVDAPEEFWASKSDRKNETYVCLDSRTIGTVTPYQKSYYFPIRTDSNKRGE